MIWALVPTIAFMGAWQAKGAIAGILVLWTAGFRLYLPVVLYALALWAFGTAAIGWRRADPWRTAGMVLLLVGGFLLDSTYQLTLALIALVLLSDGTAVGGTRARPAGNGAGRDP
jgi:hypothetical protein